MFTCLSKAEVWVSDCADLVGLSQTFGCQLTVNSDSWGYMCLLPFHKLALVCFYSLNASTFQASTCIISLNISLAKVSHVVIPGDKGWHTVPSIARSQCKVAMQSCMAQSVGRGQGRETGLTLQSITPWFLSIECVLRSNS